MWVSRTHSGTLQRERERGYEAHMRVFWNHHNGHMIFSDYFSRTQGCQWWWWRLYYITQPSYCLIHFETRFMLLTVELNCQNPSLHPFFSILTKEELPKRWPLSPWRRGGTSVGTLWWGRVFPQCPSSHSSMLDSCDVWHLYQWTLKNKRVKWVKILDVKV